MKSIGWDAYQIFLTVARHGGLTGAAQASGFSPATIGRRVLDLEQQIGRQLFARSQTGYRLTGDGQALLAELQEMDRRLAGRGTGAHGRAPDGRDLDDMADLGKHVGHLVGAGQFPA